MSEYHVMIDSENRDLFRDFLKTKPKGIISYCFGPVEIGTKTGHKHFHGYMKYSQKKDTLRKALRQYYKKEKQIHILAQRGDDINNISYCIKEGREDLITCLTPEDVAKIPQWVRKEKVHKHSHDGRIIQFNQYIEDNMEILKEDYKSFIASRNVNAKFVSLSTYYAYRFFYQLQVPFSSYQVKQYANYWMAKNPKNTPNGMFDLIMS